MIKKSKKDLRIRQLETELACAKAYHVHNHHFLAQKLNTLSTDNMLGSGIIVQFKSLSGTEIGPETVISGGLSNETLDALRKDIIRSFEERTEFKP